MVSTQEITATINALPFEQKLAVFHALEASLIAEANPHDDAVLESHIAIAEERLSRIDAGIDKPIPWDEAMRNIFKK